MSVPRVFISYSHDSPEHKDQVRRFATFLRVQKGLDTRLDQWDDNLRRDWADWAIQHLTKADFILVIASPKYKLRADGEAAPDEGRGAQFEAAMIRDKLTENLRHAVSRILPVVLPGRSVADIPAFLNPYSTTRFHVSTFTDEGVAELLAAITGRGRYSMPERGPWADEPPRTETPIAMKKWLAASSAAEVDQASIDGVGYADSVVLRAKSPGFVEIDLGGAYQRFTSVVGVLDDASEPFQVGTFRIYLDGALRWERKAAMGKTAKVDLDLLGAVRLRLEMSRTGEQADLAWGTPTLY